MRLVQEKTGLTQFTGYGADWVAVNQTPLFGSQIVTRDAIESWRPGGFDELQREDFARVLDWRPELVLLGTGNRIRFPAAVLTRDLIDSGIGIEVMDVGAVCRTFNALVNEGRQVVALVLFG